MKLDFGLCIFEDAPSLPTRERELKLVVAEVVEVERGRSLHGSVN